MLAPEPYLSACLEVLYLAAVSGRHLGWEGEHTGLTTDQSAMLHDLMHAVHNIPRLLRRWEQCDETLLRRMLEDFDTKWTGGLLGRYPEVLETAR
ncbi:MAG: hypothetical protein AB7O24_18005 [Kofleriaceae bacterium]